MKISDVPNGYRSLATSKILDYLNDCEEEICKCEEKPFTPYTTKDMFFKQFVSDIEEWVVVMEKLTKNYEFHWNNNDYYLRDKSHYKLVAQSK